MKHRRWFVLLSPAFPRLLLPIVVLMVLLGTAPGVVAEPGSSSSVIGDLEDIPRFSELFNRDAGHARLVLLLSPT